METPTVIRRSIKPMHWGVPWTWKMHSSMFLSIPTTGSTCASPFEARSTSCGRHLWIGHSSTSFHQTHGRSGRTPLNTQGSTASVFRQLAFTPARSSTASATHRVLLEGAPLFRTPQ
ncbi:hypothetical protein DPMN_044104 [Dreissena polymorpha]|uniref:Uncharacterized protein n=1 Tax=Dreissena polymorpha TaxID=45954 RepID=A0A9D4D3Z7_DREPO|nr:hypothetical protein DPMN_044104 [Dreissena polymorpha]